MSIHAQLCRVHIREHTSLQHHQGNGEDMNRRQTRSANTTVEVEDSPHAGWAVQQLARPY